jgi:hypothetical protein
VTNIFEHPSYTSGMMTMAYSETNKNQAIKNSRAKHEQNKKFDRLKKGIEKKR